VERLSRQAAAPLLVNRPPFSSSANPESEAGWRPLVLADTEASAPKRANEPAVSAASPRPGPLTEEEPAVRAHFRSLARSLDRSVTAVTLSSGGGFDPRFPPQSLLPPDGAAAVGAGGLGAGGSGGFFMSTGGGPPKLVLCFKWATPVVLSSVTVRGLGLGTVRAVALNDARDAGALARPEEAARHEETGLRSAGCAPAVTPGRRLSTRGGLHPLPAPSALLDFISQHAARVPVSTQGLGGPRRSTLGGGSAAAEGGAAGGAISGGSADPREASGRDRRPMGSLGGLQLEAEAELHCLVPAGGAACLVLDRAAGDFLAVTRVRFQGLELQHAGRQTTAAGAQAGVVSPARGGQSPHASAYLIRGPGDTGPLRSGPLSPLALALLSGRGGSEPPAPAQ